MINGICFLLTRLPCHNMCPALWALTHRSTSQAPQDLLVMHGPGGMTRGSRQVPEPARAQLMAFATHCWNLLSPGERVESGQNFCHGFADGHALKLPLSSSSGCCFLLRSVGIYWCESQQDLLQLSAHHPGTREHVRLQICKIHASNLPSLSNSFIWDGDGACESHFQLHKGA